MSRTAVSWALAMAIASSSCSDATNADSNKADSKSDESDASKDVTAPDVPLINFVRLTENEWKTTVIFAANAVEGATGDAIYQSAQTQCRSHSNDVHHLEACAVAVLAPEVFLEAGTFSDVEKGVSRSWLAGTMTGWYVNDPDDSNKSGSSDGPHRPDEILAIDCAKHGLGKAMLNVVCKGPSDPLTSAIERAAERQAEHERTKTMAADSSLDAAREIAAAE